jgi:hypothetical protein
VLFIRFFEGPAAAAGRQTPMPADPKERLEVVLKVRAAAGPACAARAAPQPAAPQPAEATLLPPPPPLLQSLVDVDLIMSTMPIAIKKAIQAGGMAAQAR